MPLIIKNKVSDNSVLTIWKVEESLDDLLFDFCFKEDEHKMFSSITNEGRKKQWLITRILLSELSGSEDLWITYDDNRKPHLNNIKYSISISHTQDYVAILFGENVQLGIDIEKLHPRIYKIRNKFCSETENSYLTDDEFLLSRLYLIWSAKEALFKMYGKGNLDFRKNLHIHPFEFKPPGKLATKIKYKDVDVSVELLYNQINDHVVVYGMSHLKLF